MTCRQSRPSPRGDLQDGVAVGGGGEAPVAVGQSLEEAEVMADQEQAAGAVGEGLFQAFDAGQVHMVGGFVHDDEVRAAGDAAGQEDFADFAGTGLVALQQALGTGTEAADNGHDAAEFLFRAVGDVGQDLA